MKVFYHTDLDGIASAEIINYYNRQQGVTEIINFYSINYKDKFPIEKIKSMEVVYVVDFSLSERDFDSLLEITNNVVWIDHHKSAIETLGRKYNYLQGIREDGRAGCVLTWAYFYGNTIPLPPVIDMLGAYDVWDFSKHGDDLNKLQCGIRLDDHSPDNYAFWKEIIEYDYRLKDIIKMGEIALIYRNNQYSSIIKGWSFIAEFEGFKAVCCNVGSVSSQLFDSVKESYDLMMPFVFDGSQWTVSIYTKRDDIDCSELAKKYGGGGHRKASGFQCKELPIKCNKPIERIK